MTNGAKHDYVMIDEAASIPDAVWQRFKEQNMTITKKQADDYADQSLDFVSAFMSKHPKTVLVIFAVIEILTIVIMRG